MRIKILGICGSPRKGNSKFLLDKALSYAKSCTDFEVEVETYLFKGKEFKPCLGCGYCGNNQGTCIHNDDFSDLKNKWMNSDAILYSVPVYHMSIPGQVKCFIDRLGNTFFGFSKNIFPDNENSLPKLLKVIGSITQGAHIFSGQEHTLTDLINHALIMQSIPVVGDMWESYLGAAGWTNNKDGLTIMKEDFSKGNFDVKVAVKAAEKLAKRLVEMAVIVRSGMFAHQSYFEKQIFYQPFIEFNKSGK